MPMPATARRDCDGRIARRSGGDVPEFDGGHGAAMALQREVQHERSGARERNRRNSL